MVDAVVCGDVVVGESVGAVACGGPGAWTDGRLSSLLMCADSLDSQLERQWPWLSARVRRELVRVVRAIRYLRGRAERQAVDAGSVMSERVRAIRAELDGWGCRKAELEDELVALLLRLGRRPGDGSDQPSLFEGEDADRLF